MPQVGRRYVLFLKAHSDAEDFSIITGYEIREGHVFPLDVWPGSDPFAAYEGVEAANFIARIQSLIGSVEGPTSSLGIQDVSAICETDGICTEVDPIDPPPDAPPSARTDCVPPSVMGRRYAWGQGDTVVVNISPSFSDAQKECIKTAFQNWQAASDPSTPGGNGSGVKFVFSSVAAPVVTYNATGAVTVPTPDSPSQPVSLPSEFGH
jgi:hypothetical protein